MFIKVPLYRLQELGTKALKESYVASFEEKLKSRVLSRIRPKLRWIRSNPGPFDRMGVEFAISRELCNFGSGVHSTEIMEDSPEAIGFDRMALNSTKTVGYNLPMVSRG